MIDIEKITQEVKALLGGGDGHGIDHVLRVRDMAISFAKQEEGVNILIVELASLLHDVDDYKIFGEKSANSLKNATAILSRYQISEDVSRDVLNILMTMGYSKYLEGIRPLTAEGMIVSDADMCDAIGAEGILRTHAYALSKGDLFFDPTLPPKRPESDANEYRTMKRSHSVQHFFDKLLILPSIMMTDAGRDEAQRRKKIMMDFLNELFRESDAPEWSKYLEDFIIGGQ